MMILEFIFRNFLTWLGAMSMLYLITNFFTNLLNNFMYHRTVRKIGYPPSHCTDNSGTATIKEEHNEN